MKKLLFILLALCMTMVIYAQERVSIKAFKEEVSDLSARTNRRYDLNDEACALIKVQYPKRGAFFEGTVVGDVEYKNGEYWIYVAKGTKRIKIHLPETPTMVLEFSAYGIQQTESNTTYSVEFDFHYSSSVKTAFYVEAGFVVSSAMGPELSVGAYIGGFNAEVNVMLPMAKSDDITWYKGADSKAVCSYKPSFAVGGRVGYGIKASRSLRITPQAGVIFMKTSETVDGGKGEIVSGAYCSSLVVAVKAEYLLSKHIAVSLTPEYYAPMMKSEGFKALSDVSSKIKGWNSGIGCKLALAVVF